MTEVADYSFIRKLIWVYFLLLIFEGGARKWILTGWMSDALLIIRDPFVIWIYYLASIHGVFPLKNKYIQKCEKATFSIC